MWALLRRNAIAAVTASLVVALIWLTPPVGRDTIALGAATPAPLSPSRLITPAFVDRTLDAGLIHVHHQGDHVLTGLNETLGPGACAFDYNNDGWVDLFAVGGSGDTRYY